VTAFFKHRITSGRIESFNNQIARLIHRACGMTNLKHLFLKMRAQSLKQI
jgi:transposase